MTPTLESPQVYAGYQTEHPLTKGQDGVAVEPSLMTSMTDRDWARCVNRAWGEALRDAQYIQGEILGVFHEPKPWGWISWQVHGPGPHAVSVARIAVVDPRWLARKTGHASRARLAIRRLMPRKDRKVYTIGGSSLPVGITITDAFLGVESGLITATATTATGVPGSISAGAALIAAAAGYGGSWRFRHRTRKWRPREGGPAQPVLRQVSVDDPLLDEATDLVLAVEHVARHLAAGAVTGHGRPAADREPGQAATGEDILREIWTCMWAAMPAPDGPDEDATSYADAIFDLAVRLPATALSAPPAAMAEWPTKAWGSTAVARDHLTRITAALSTEQPPAAGAAMEERSAAIDLPLQLAAARAAHETVKNAYAAFCFDPHSVFGRPLLNDVTEPSTAAFYEAQEQAAALETDPGQKIPDQHAVAYIAAVDVLTATWDAADAHAREVGVSRLTTGERTSLRRAQVALDRALDPRTPAGERELAYRRVLELIEGLIVLPEPAADQVRRQVAAAPEKPALEPGSANRDDGCR